MWLSNTQNNFAPFAGYMLVGFERHVPLERASEEFDELVEDASGGGETTAHNLDAAPL